MNVRTGGAAGHARYRDLLAARDLLALFDLNLAQVAVHGDEDLAVIDEHTFAIEEIIAGVDHRARSRRVHWRGDIDRGGEAGMRAARLVVENPPQPVETAGGAGRRRQQGE